MFQWVIHIFYCKLGKPQQHATAYDLPEFLNHDTHENKCIDDDNVKKYAYTQTVYSHAIH